MQFRPKLSDEQVREIRHSQESARALADHYDVSHPTILNIRAGRTYKHVPYETVGATHGLPNNQYDISDALSFLRLLPDGYCETVVTSFPQRQVSISGIAGALSHTREPRWDMSGREYAEWRYDIIDESIRVAGIKGLVLYHFRFRNLLEYLDTARRLVSRSSLRQIIIWNHGGRNPATSLRPQDKTLRNTHDVIFMFTGRYWSIPEDIAEVADQWGTVWDIPITSESRRYKSPFPAELAERCIALGVGRVLDPFARSGSTVLAAIDVGREWLACDTEKSMRELFEKRRSITA